MSYLGKLIISPVMISIVAKWLPPYYANHLGLFGGNGPCLLLQQSLFIVGEILTRRSFYLLPSPLPSNSGRFALRATSAENIRSVRRSVETRLPGERLSDEQRNGNMTLAHHRAETQTRLHTEQSTEASCSGRTN